MDIKYKTINEVKNISTPSIKAFLDEHNISSDKRSKLARFIHIGSKHYKETKVELFIPKERPADNILILTLYVDRINGNTRNEPSLDNLQILINSDVSLL